MVTLRVIDGADGETKERVNRCLGASEENRTNIETRLKLFRQKMRSGDLLVLNFPYLGKIIYQKIAFHRISAHM